MCLSFDVTFNAVLTMFQGCNLKKLNTDTNCELISSHLNYDKVVCNVFSEWSINLEKRAAGSITTHVESMRPPRLLLPGPHPSPLIYVGLEGDHFLLVFRSVWSIKRSAAFLKCNRESPSFTSSYWAVESTCHRK